VIDVLLGVFSIAVAGGMASVLLHLGRESSSSGKRASRGSSETAAIERIRRDSNWSQISSQLSAGRIDLEPVEPAPFSVAKAMGEWR
jgi:hypothetical protein